MKTEETKSPEANQWANFSKNIALYQTPSLWKSIWQIANTFIPYVGFWVLIVYSLFGFALAYSIINYFGSRFFGSVVYHFSRLWTWFVF